ncbi:hypothetical protein G3I19_16110, partial [Streptomyces sp. SID10853]|uniref:DALR anticodon-binding domain-containing protein n=1 Tax=Streptomyces sp. SID10853 TaxID=2706028 RepID=UPI0013C1E78F
PAGTPGRAPVPAPAPAPTDRPGRDAARWGALFGGGGDELLVRRESNPLFRVQYAHARSRALLRNARDLGFGAAYGTAYDASCERDRAAAALVAALADYPAAVETAAGHRIARQLVVVADAFLAFHVAVLPVGDEKPSAAHRSRLALTEAAGTVLAGGLSLLGISAPEHI